MSTDPRVERGVAAAVAGALGIGYFATACPYVLGADKREAGCKQLITKTA